MTIFPDKASLTVVKGSEEEPNSNSKANLEPVQTDHRPIFTGTIKWEDTSDDNMDMNYADG